MESSTSTLPDSLKTLMELNRSIAGSLDESDILREGLRLEKEIVSAERGSILLLDESGDYLEFTVALGDEESVLENYRVEIGEGLAGHVAENREPVVVKDTSQDPRFAEFFDEQTGFETKSILCVPIQVGERLLGVAEAINKQDGGSFTDQDLVAFCAFAGQIAVALNNARLHEELVSRERVEQQLKSARKVQKTYLPESFPEIDSLEFGARLEPAARVSGDFYDCFESEDGDVILLIGDVSGKGLPAALHMCRTMMELRTDLRRGTNPARVLTRVNRHLFETSTQGMFVTLTVFRINPETQRLQATNAGHVPLLIRRPNSTEVQNLTDDPPLGIVPDHEYSLEEWTLEEDVLVNAVTDGILDARDDEGHWFREERLQEVIERTQLPPKLLVDLVFARVDRFSKEDRDPTDDRTMVAFGKPSRHDRYEFTVESHPDYLSLVRKATGELLDRDGADSGTINELQTGMDEAVCNIIEHTYHNRKNGIIEVTLEIDGNRFRAILRDYGPPVDPGDFEDSPTPREAPGGLGLQLMREYFDRSRYDTSISEGNRLILERTLER